MRRQLYLQHGDAQTGAYVEMAACVCVCAAVDGAGGVGRRARPAVPNLPEPRLPSCPQVENLERGIKAGKLRLPDSLMIWNV